MFNKAVKNVAVLLLGSFMILGNANAKEMKIGYVDFQAVAQQLPQMAAIEQTIKDEFKERVDAIKKLEADINFNIEKLKREGATLSTAEQDKLKKVITDQRKDYDSKAGPLQKQMQQRYAEERNKIGLMIQQAINEVSKSGNYDLVLRKETIAYSNESDNFDITDKVAEKAKSKK